MTLTEDLAQQLWQTFVATCGRSMPEGMADALAQAAIEALGLTEETRTLTNGWIQPMYRAMEEQHARDLSIITGQPYVEPPPPKIEDQRRFVTPWEPVT